MRKWGSERLRRKHESCERGKSLTRLTTRRCAVEFDAYRVTQCASARLKPTAFAALPNSKTALRADTKTPPSEATRKCTIRATKYSLAKTEISSSYKLEWENGIFSIPFSNSNSELELQHALSSQIIQCFSNVALFVLVIYCVFLTTRTIRG